LKEKQQKKSKYEENESVSFCSKLGFSFTHLQRLGAGDSTYKRTSKHNIEKKGIKRKNKNK